MKLPKLPQNNTKLSIKSDERGIASFIVTLILILVITLIVLGFSQVARRNQRESVDDQLSTQAYYAAESGVNLVKSLLGNNTPDKLKKTDCQATAADTLYINQQLNDSTNDVHNSCLMVDDGPSSLQYDTIDSNNTVVPIRASSATDSGTGTLTLTWQSKDTAPVPSVTNCSTNSSYDNFTNNLGANCPYGILRFDMVDLTYAGSLNPDDLTNSTVAVYAPPTSHNNQQAIYEKEGTQSLDVNVGNVICTDSPAQCSLTIGNIDYSHVYYMRVTSIYRPVKLQIEGTVNGGPVQFTGAQLLVDSTGKSVDVLRRVQVRLDEARNLSPAYAIEGTSGICKLYTTEGPGSGLSGACP